MPTYPSAISSLNADQAAAAGSLVRLLTSRFDTLPVAETDALAQTLLAQDGLVADIRNLLHTMASWAGRAMPDYEGPHFDFRHILADTAEELADLPPLPEGLVLPVPDPGQQTCAAPAATGPATPGHVVGRSR
ncbi:hypothetical protein [Streptomyces sp. NBC_01006]|uniref:hypothetical protein n=1 Tax=Streptomyces sp. NBC_01006 TaxID=2903716 RepID=UPI0038648389|nr:hypothetical protein OG509_32420 [Streptomyces sp. NBC_01006]